MYVKNFDSNKDHTEELLNAFKVFDTGMEGTISSEQLFHNLTHMGEKFSEKQAADFYEELKKKFENDKVIDFRLLTKILVNSYTNY